MEKEIIHYFCGDTNKIFKIPSCVDLMHMKKTYHTHVKLTHLVLNVNPLTLDDNDKIKVQIFFSVKTTLFEYGIKYLALENGFMIENNKYIIPMPKDINTIYLEKLFYCGVTLHINTTSEKFINYKVLYEIICDDTKKNLNEFCEIIHKNKYICSFDNKSEINIIVSNYQRSIGYFIKSPISNIKNLQIYSIKDNNITGLLFDSDSEKSFIDNEQVKVYNNNFFFVSLNKKISDLNKCNHLNFNSLYRDFVDNYPYQSVYIKLIFFEQNENFSLYTNTYNVMKYSMSIAGKFFSGMRYKENLHVYCDKYKLDNTNEFYNVFIKCDYSNSNYFINNIPPDTKVMEVLSYKYIPMLNLPSCLEKLTINFNIQNIKLPFGCKLINI